MQTIFILLICIFVYIPSILILSTLKGKKPYKVKEDILFIEKHIFYFLILTLYILFYLYELLRDEEDEENKEKGNEPKCEPILLNLCKIKIICFNVYIILHFSSNFFICIENYKTYTHPNYYFNSLFNKRKNNILYEFLSIIFAAIFSLLYLDIKFKKNLNLYFKVNFNFDRNKFLIILSDDSEDFPFDQKYKDINEKYPFIILNSFKLVYILILNIITLIMYIVLKYKIKKIIFKAREKLFRIFTKRIILSFLYIIFILFNMFVFYYFKKFSEEKELELFCMINSWLFLFVYILDSLFELSIYSTSKFAQYKLKYTIVDSLGSIFNRNRQEENASNSLLDSMIRETSNNNGRYDNSSDDSDEENSFVMPLNNNDIELILIYRNHIFIEDYFFYYYDYIINVTLSSLYKIYRTKNFSPVILNNNQLNKELNISESAIFDVDKNNKSNLSNNLSNNPTFKKIDTGGSDELTYESNGNNDEYIFIRNSGRNDFGNTKEIFTNTINDFSYDNITVKIKSYFTSKCISNLLDKNITSNIFNNSLRSHLNKNNNEKEKNNVKINRNNISGDNNIDLPYHSILSSNAKEEYFLHLKNMSIKTYDKQLTFDIFESNDEDISLDKNNSNKKLATMINKYFDYIQKVGVSGTFIPILLGIFKVKINSFKTMLIYISCNSLIENTPLNNYSYWQLIRFSYNEKKRIASSKYRHNVLLGDDLIFDRKYAISSIKGENYSNKIEIKNFSCFKDTLKQDINFLNKCGANDIKLLMLYFEYQNIKKSQNSQMRINKKEDNKAEMTINSVTMPIFKEDEQSKDNIYVRDFSKKDDTEVATIPTIPLSKPDLNNDRISPDISNRFSVLNSNYNENKKNIDNENNKNEIINQNNNNINENLVIEFNQSETRKDNILKNSNNSMVQSLYGSLINADLLEDAMASYDDATGKDKNSLGIVNNDLLSYIEKIKINSFDGYYDSNNCMCLFSFENIFNYKPEGCCNYFNFNLLKRNILSNFIDYTPREPNIINKSNKIE